MIDDEATPRFTSPLCDDRELLPIFLPKPSARWSYDGEELVDDGEHAVKVSRSVRTLPQGSDCAGPHRRSFEKWTDLFLLRNEYDSRSSSGCDLEVRVQRLGILGIVRSVVELDPVDKDADHRFSRRRCCVSNEACMPFVQCAHGWNECN